MEFYTNHRNVARLEEWSKRRVKDIWNLSKNNMKKSGKNEKNYRKYFWFLRQIYLKNNENRR